MNKLWNKIIQARRITGRTLVVASMITALGVAFTAPAFADPPFDQHGPHDRHDPHDRAWANHERHARDWHDHHPVYVHQGPQVVVERPAPTVVFTPPAVISAPPAEEAPAGLSLNLNFD